MADSYKARTVLALWVFAKKGKFVTMGGMQKQKNLILAVIIVVLGAGFFIYSDLKGKKAVSVKTEQQPAGKIDVGLPGATEVQVVAGKDEGPAALVKVPAPDLNRPVVFSVSFSDSDKVKITAKISELSAILKKNNNSFDDWISLGLVRKTIGDYEGARQAWEYGSAIRTKNSLSFRNLGDLYHYYLKDYPKAEQNLKQSIKNDPSDIGTYRALVDLYTQSYTEKLSEVPTVLTAGLKANPEQYDLFIMMASYYKGAGDKANAKMYYEKALAVADKSGMTNMKQVITDEINKL